MFLLKLSWYSDNESLSDEFESLRKGTTNVIDLMTNIIKTKKSNEFPSNCIAFIEKWKQYDKSFDRFRLKLVKS